MSDLLATMAEDVDESAEGADLSRLVALAGRMFEVGQELNKTEARLKELKEDYRKIAEGEIPDLMAELGVKEFTLENGAKIVVDRKITTHISQANWEAARDWLVSHKCDSLIKTEVKAEFDKGHRAEADALIGSLKHHGTKHTFKQYVHPQTLSKFVRDWLEEGDELPECFTVYEVRQAKITLP